MNKNIWGMLGEKFDASVPRMTSFIIKEKDDTIYYAFPSGWDYLGIEGLFPLAYHLVDNKRAKEMEKNFVQLLGKYGIRTFSPCERGYRSDTYWRGASWPQSCSLGMEVCRYYYPHLLDQVLQSLTGMVTGMPGIWECYDSNTGFPAHSDQGFLSTPCISSNVGAGGILGSLMTYHGLYMYGYDNTLPLVFLKNFHWAGMWINVYTEGDRWAVEATPAEKNTALLKFRDINNNIYEVSVAAGKKTWKTQERFRCLKCPVSDGFPGREV